MSRSVQVTTLIVPGVNDDENELRSLSQWLASVCARAGITATFSLLMLITGGCQHSPSFLVLPCAVCGRVG